jgi:hypothetical protein
MKLVTIQTKKAYENFLKEGFLTADSQYINKLKYGVPYQYIVDNMQHIENPHDAEFPLWAWVKYGGFVSPPKNKLLGFFAKDEDEIVRITFEKLDKDVLVSDYIKYHFLLTNEYLPGDLNDFQTVEKKIQDAGISKEDLLAYVRRDKFETYRKDKKFEEINQVIQKSYEKIFSDLGDFRQGTVWSIEKSEVKKVEIICRKDCTKKASVDYRKQYIKTLKQKGDKNGF